jgi:hypothetical protein
MALLLEDVLRPRIVYTAYNTIVYLKLGPKGQGLMNSPNPRVELHLPIRSKKNRTASKKSPLAIADEDGWISPRKAKSTKKKPAGKSKPKTKKSKKTRKKQKTSKSKMPTIECIEILGSSSSEDSSDDDDIIPRPSINKKKDCMDDTSDDEDSEFELSD